MSAGERASRHPLLEPVSGSLRELESLGSCLAQVIRAEARTAAQALHSLEGASAAAERDHGQRRRELRVLDATLIGAPPPPLSEDAAAAREGASAAGGRSQLSAAEGPKPLRLHVAGCTESQDEVRTAEEMGLPHELRVESYTLYPMHGFHPCL